MRQNLIRYHYSSLLYFLHCPSHVCSYLSSLFLNNAAPLDVSHHKFYIIFLLLQVFELCPSLIGLQHPQQNLFLKKVLLLSFTVNLLKSSHCSTSMISTTKWPFFSSCFYCHYFNFSTLSFKGIFRFSIENSYCFS